MSTDDGQLSQEALDALMGSLANSTEEYNPDYSDGPPEESIDDPGQAEEPVEAQGMPFADMGTGAQPSSSGASALKMASFGESPSQQSPSPLHGFDRVQDIPLEVAVELGRTKILIKDILELGSGSIIELEKMAGEPVDLFANGLLIARGEVVVIEDNFGVRVTEIITSAERKALVNDPGALNAA